MEEPQELQLVVGKTETTLPRWVAYHLATLTVAMLLIVIAGVVFVQHTVTVEDRRVRAAIVQEGRVQCAVYTLLDGAYKVAPPTTDTGRAFAAAIHRVVAGLGC